MVQHAPLWSAILSCNNAVCREYDVVIHQFRVMMDSLMAMVFGNCQTSSPRVSVNDQWLEIKSLETRLTDRTA
jgi:hypothetical protein